MTGLAIPAPESLVVGRLVEVALFTEILFFFAGPFYLR
jgi:hypothetical protein